MNDASFFLRRPILFFSAWALLLPAALLHAADGQVKVIGAIYDISNGSVVGLGEHPKQSDLIPKVAH